MSEELSESEETGKHRKTRWERPPPPRCRCLLLALTPSVRPSVELPPKRMRRSREVTSRRRSGAELKCRNPLPATRRCLKCSKRSKKFPFPCSNAALKPSDRYGGQNSSEKVLFLPPRGPKIRELNLMCNFHRAARKTTSSKTETTAKGARKSAKS